MHTESSNTKVGVANDDAGGDSMEDVEYDDDDFGEL